MVKYVLVDVEKLPESQQLAAKLRILGDLKPVVAYDVCGVTDVFDERFNEHWVRDFEEEEDAEEVMLGFARHVGAEWLVHLYDGDRGVFALANGALRLAPLQRVGAKTYRFAGRLDLENLSLSDEVVDPCEENLKLELEELVRETLSYVRSMLEDELRANERLPHDTVDTLNEAVSALEAAERYICEKYLSTK
jgi:hypothetical protein